MALKQRVQLTELGWKIGKEKLAAKRLPMVDDTKVNFTTLLKVVEVITKRTILGRKELYWEEEKLKAV